MDAHPPLGRVYIPTASYGEMDGWALPVDEQPVFNRLMDHAASRNLPDMRFLRGALWRNFQARYREINDLHKQMLRVSAEVDRMPSGELRDRARDHLFRGQSNDCYWHGWFGGVYIVHMRMATLAELIGAEDLALGVSTPLTGVADYDLDGIDEVALGTAGQTVIVDVAEGAGIGSWDLRPARVALASVLRRRPEPYHDTIWGAQHATEIVAKHERLAESIEYDDHERRTGLVRVLDPDGVEVDDFDRLPWRIEEVTDSALAVIRDAGGLRLRKSIGVDGDRYSGSLTLGVEVEAENAFRGTLELEWNINLLGGGGNPAAYYRSGDVEWRHDSAGSVEAGAELSFGNTYEGVNIALEADPPAPADWFAVETVSNSDSGYERVYQGSCLVQRWPLALDAGQHATFATILRLTQSRDRSAEEAPA